jgi:quercetin dioxygenase-like cupin family protein
MTGKLRTAAAITCALAIGVLAGGAIGQDGYPAVELLLQSSTTTIDQPVSYPSAGQPEITAAIVTMQPGDTSDWHRHEVPMFAWVMQGAVTVDYGPAGTRSYAQGDALLEAIGMPHNGRATADVPTRILVVFAGSSAAENTVMLGQADTR